MLEYKNDCKNESMIKHLPREINFLTLILMFLKIKGGLKEHTPLQTYQSYLEKWYCIEVTIISLLWWVSMGYESNKNEYWVNLFNN